MSFLGMFVKCENQLLASSCLSVRVCVEQLDSHSMDFHEV